MRKTFVAILVSVLLAVPLSPAATRVLFVSGPDTHGWGEHEHSAGIQLLADAVKANVGNFDVVVHHGGWPDDSGAFDGVKAVVLYGDGEGLHPLLGHEKQAAELMKAGMSFVCLHYALDVGEEKLAPLMLDWLGGYFEPDWSVNPVWKPADLQLAEHPVTRGVKPFAVEDEWYFHMRFRPGMQGVTPLVSCRAPLETLSEEDGPRTGNAALRDELRRGVPQHLAWAAETAGGGRAFGFTGGHSHWLWENDDIRRLIVNAIVWTAGQDVPEGGIDSERPIIVRNKTLLHAVSRGDAADIERHILKGADPNEARKSGWRPLHYAVLRNKADVARVLIRHGADINAQTGKGATCLHMSVERDYTEMTALLLDHKPDLTLLNGDGWTALHVAAARDRVAPARLLLDKGAGINTRSKAGGTPLHEAAAGAGEEMIRLLLDRGVDRTVKSHNGRTALDVARVFGNETAVKILTETR
jgi:hypothetical protein